MITNFLHDFMVVHAGASGKEDHGGQWTPFSLFFSTQLCAEVSSLCCYFGRSWTVSGKRGKADRWASPRGRYNGSLDGFENVRKAFEYQC
tara:strand:- start:366 stop:635 length:270 start_codon:yes stop_codon:yes gene_type:complete